MEILSEYDLKYRTQINYANTYLNYYLVTIEKLFKDDRHRDCEEAVLKTGKRTFRIYPL